MNRRTRRMWTWLALLASGAVVFQSVGFTATNGAFRGGCAQFGVNGVTSAVDMCYLLDCQNGFLGGLVNPCDASNPALLDCTNYVPPTNDGTDTTNGAAQYGGFGG